MSPEIAAETLVIEFDLVEKNQQLFVKVASRVISGKPANLVLDISRVKAVDETGLKFLSKINGKLTARGLTLSLAGGADALKSVLSRTGAIWMSTGAALTASRAAVPFLQEKTLKCPVCGDRNVRAWICDLSQVEYRWEKDPLLPSSYRKGTTEKVEITYYEPIVCSDCLMGSLRYEDFIGMELETRFTSEQLHVLNRRIASRKNYFSKLKINHGDAFVKITDPKMAAIRFWLVCETQNAISFENNNPRHFDSAYAKMRYYFLEGMLRDRDIQQEVFTGFQAFLKQKNRIPLDRVPAALYYYIYFAIQLDQRTELLWAVRDINEFTRAHSADPGMTTLVSFWRDTAQKYYKEIITNTVRENFI
jgi:anti-anti-sigma regulatory factor